MPHRPDGCVGGEFPVGPPPQPIPPPCLVGWTVEHGYDGGLATSLLITIAHPELSSYAPHGWVRLVNYGPAWQLVEIDAEMSCGKDEAPFAWATLHILNGGDADAALAAYTGPLPRFDDLITLAGWHRIYLPLVSRDGDTPSPVTHKQLQE